MTLQPANLPDIEGFSASCRGIRIVRGSNALVLIQRLAIGSFLQCCTVITGPPFL